MTLHSVRALFAAVALIGSLGSALAADAVRYGSQIGAQYSRRLALEELQSKYNLKYEFKDFRSGTENILALEYSERVFLGCHSDIAGVKSLWDMLKSLREVPFSFHRFTLVFNGMVSHHRANYSEWLKARKIDIRYVHQAPVDSKVCLDSLTKGTPEVILDPDSQVSSFIRTLVTESLNIAPAEEPRVGLWGRFMKLIR